MNMKPHLFSLMLCFSALAGSSQSVLADQIRDTTASNGKGYHVFVAKIRKIDTIMFVDRSYAANSAMSVQHFQMIRVKFRKKRKLACDFRKIPLVLMPVITEEHNCNYDFQKGSVYRVYTMYTRYSSPSALKKYRRYWLQLDCNKQPVPL